MPQKDPEVRRAYYREWYKKNQKTARISIHKAKRRQVLLIRAWLFEERQKGQCFRCGFSDPRALDFHHRDPETKSFSLGAFQSRSLGMVKREREKCDLICANCHRILHAEEKTPTSSMWDTE